MKVKSAIKKIETRLKGEEYTLNVEIDDRDASSFGRSDMGKFVLLYKDRVVTFDVSIPWDSKEKRCQDLRDGSVVPTKEDFYEYGKVGSIHSRRFDDHSDLMTDYFAGYFPKNVTQALDSLKAPPSKYKVGDLVMFKNNKRMGRWGVANKIGVITKDRGKIYNIMVCESNVEQTYISERDIQVVK